MKILIAILFALGAAPAVLAARLLPADVQAGTLSAASGSSVQFTARPSSVFQSLIGLILPSGQNYTLAPGVRIFDADNRFLLSGQIGALAGRNVGVTFDNQGNINRIWVLSDDEAALLKQRASQAALPTE